MQTLVDRVSSVLSHVALQLSARMAAGHSILLWSMAYIVSLALMYLFHSPFRAHTACRTDWYAQLTKILQIWIGIVIVLFHLGPQFLVTQGHQNAGEEGESTTTADDGGPALVFVPTFSALNMLFLFLHKFKRRLRMGVTYGPGFTVILLNSILLSVFTMVHYSACSEITSMLQEKRQRHKAVASSTMSGPGNTTRPGTQYHLSDSGLSVASIALRAVCPASHVLMHPFATIAHLLLIDVFFVYLDYRYKGYRGFDPTRGILFSEQYKIRKNADAVAALESEAASAEAASPQKSAMPAGRRNGAAQTGKKNAPPSFRRRRLSPQSPQSAEAAAEEEDCLQTGDASESKPATASSWWWSWWWWHLTRNEAKMREAYRKYDFRYKEPTPTRVAASRDPRKKRTPASLASSVATSIHQREERKGNVNGGANGADLISVSSLPDDASSDGSTGTNTSSREKVSFPLSRREMNDLKSSLHPDNKTGMVPWFSTFILNTSWQSVAYEALAFLVFDVRVLEETKHPKIFDLSFHQKVSSIEAARRRQQQQQQQQRYGAVEAMPPTPAYSFPRSHGQGAFGFAPLPEGLLSPSTADSRTQHLRTETADTDASTGGAGEDVWFDWVADIGDGFNSTYEVARLLAQPMLALRDVGSWMATGAVPQPHHRWPSFPARDHFRRCSSGDVRPHARTRTPPAFHSPIDAFSSRSLPEDAAADRSPTQSSLAEVSCAAGSPTVTAIRTSNNSHVKRSTSFAGVACPNRPLTAAVRSSDTNFSSAASPNAAGTVFARARSEYGNDANGFQYNLPRGSFVLVGGDLAYPNPSDETFLTRFIGPYNDALRSHRGVQQLYHAYEDEIVEQDLADADVAHIRMLDATVVSDIARDKCSPFSWERGSAEEALRSVPLLFAIPGNHEWLDGLSTYRKYILEKTWIGGWLMPQQTSYFVLKLPHNWFILCTDCGTQKDINPNQRNYFLGVVEKYMDADSCVILTSHEPGWIYDAMLRKDKAQQPELNRLALALGTRLRLWLAGDIHHYSRHTPRDPTSEAPTLVVSGSGGAFMHGPRRSPVIHQGTEYVRTTAFPHSNTYMSLVSRLVAFRLINWKFDLVVGACCFFVVTSMLPQPYGTAGMESIHDVGDFMVAWTALTSSLIQHLFSKAIVSLFAVLGFFVGFSSAGAENGAPLLARGVHGAVWTFLVILSCCGMLAYVECCIGYMANNRLIMSSEGTWRSALDEHVRLTTDTLLNHTRELIGDSTVPSAFIWRIQRSFYGSKVTHCVSLLLKCLDPIETLAFLSVKVSSPGLSMGKVSPNATRTEVMLYYANFLFFYWILVTPLVSFLIGCFLFVSATFFDCLYDPAYSAFQIEDYKGFLRIRIDARTRELHVYVVGEKKVPKVWAIDTNHLDELNRHHRSAAKCDHSTSSSLSGAAGITVGVPPPHLWRNPSRWRSSLHSDAAFDPAEPVAHNAVRGRPEVLEHFVCRPHFVERVDDADFLVEGNASDAGA